jgi:antitoxin component HigA of HigAB toxin-antitoxin module
MPFKSSQAGRKCSDRKPAQKAAVIETADHDLSPGTSTVDKKILERIQKCLDRAHHANSSEFEAKAALFVSQKLMSQHNVTQADLLASDGSNSKASFGGHSKVRITKTGGSDKRVMMEAFVEWR